MFSIFCYLSVLFATLCPIPPYPTRKASGIWTNLGLSASLWTTSSFADILQISPSQVGIWAKVAGSFKPIEGQRVPFLSSWAKRRIFPPVLGFGRCFDKLSMTKQRRQRRKRPARICILCSRYIVGTAAASAFEARFLCECAEIAPLAVRPDWLLEFAERCQLLFTRSSIAAVFRIRYCFILLSVHRSDVKHFSPAISSRCQELFTPWFPTVFAITAAGVKNRLHFYSPSHFHISAKGVKACLHRPCFWVYSTNAYI